MELPAKWFFEIVGSIRPYTTPGSTAEWMLLEPVEISAYGLVTTQLKICPRAVYRALRGLQSVGCIDVYPHIVSHGGRLWISDGHHRIIAKRLRGNKRIKVRLYMENEP